LSGAIDARGALVFNADDQRPTRQRTPEADAIWLKQVFKWGAEKARDPQGRIHLRENPLRGYRPEKEKNPRQPVSTEDRMQKVMAKVDHVHPYLGDILTIIHWHGRRIGAVLALTYGDVKMNEGGAHGSIAWPGETDKEGKQWNCAMQPGLKDMFETIMRERPGIGAAPIFPSPRDPTRPIGYKQACTWLRRAEKLAKLEPLEGGRWHPYRRKWATERKHHPDVDVARAGGWSNLNALKNAYQHDDPDTTLEVLTNRKALRRAN
jgi:integrase